MSDSTKNALSAGLLSGLLLALTSFGAFWLWIPSWGERAEFLLRLVASLPALGALLGLAGGLLYRATKTQARFAAALLVALSPALLTTATLLFEGGKMSRLAIKTPAMIAVGLVLLALVPVAVFGCGRVVAGATQASRIRTGSTVAAMLALAFGLTKLDQHLLPTQYLYLHGWLGVLAWLAGTVGFLVLLRAPSAPAPVRAIKQRAPMALLASLVLLAAHLLTLSRSPNIRVALFDPRSATSRSVMRLLDPVASRLSPVAKVGEAALERARQARARRQGDTTEIQGLPELQEPHVLLITIDALRPDHLGAYGYTRKISPNIDKLAGESIVFERTYTQAPHSSYSLCSLMTSEYLHELTDLGYPLPESTLASTFAESGYHTAAFYTKGIFHTEGERLETYRKASFHFERFDNTDYRAAELTDAILSEWDRIIEQGEQKSLVWGHYFDVHAPYEDTSLGHKDIDRYDSEIRITDREIGRLIRGVRAKSHRPVVIAISADHGEEFREHGGVYHGSTLYDEQIRIPLIIHVPQLAPRRVATSLQTESIDIAPTLLRLAGIEPPTSMRGDDVRPLMIGHPVDLGPAFSVVSSKKMAMQWPYKLIADLRFNLFELYDLEHDPSERNNLVATKPAIAEQYKSDLFAWLDSIGTRANEGTKEGTKRQSPAELALHRGRMGDRRAVTELVALLQNQSTSLDNRREAARIIGRLADPDVGDALAALIHDPDPLIAAEAAIALGRIPSKATQPGPQGTIYDARSKPQLLELVHSEDPDLRSRAAVSLGRLRDARAVPALIEGMWVAPTTYEREESIRWLGRLRDPRAIEPLLSMLPEFRMRYLIVIALGEIGDRRVYPVMEEMLDWEDHANVRDSLIRGLGLLGDRRIVDRLVKVSVEEPDLKMTSESLVRLGAIDAGIIGGADVHDGLSGMRGMGRCKAGPWRQDWEYMYRTHCSALGATAEIPLRVSRVLSDAPSTLLISARSASAASRIRMSVGGKLVAEFDTETRWLEKRLPIPAGTWRSPNTTAIFESTGDLMLDHVLIVPTPPN